MKKALLSAGILLGVCGFGSLAMAQDDRVTVDTPDGQMSCIFDGADYSDCVPADSLRYVVDVGDGQQMACLWQDGNYVDCLPYDATTGEVIEDSGVVADSNDDVADQDFNSQNQNQRMYSQPNQIYEEEKANVSSASEDSDHLSYWDDTYGIPNGITFGTTLGWFGQFHDGNNANGLAVGLDAGLKWTHLGGELDMDLSVSPTDKRNENFWTYSFSALFMTYWPIAESLEAVIGFGIGYTGWSLDYEYSVSSYHYDWLDDVYYKDTDSYSQNLERGGFLSLKLRARMDIVLDNWTMGLEFVWIPLLDVDNGGKVANNIVGVVLRVGDIE